jgi:hypothetical protein
MVRTLNLKADVPANREFDLHITLPADVPMGTAEIVLVVSSPVESKSATLGDLLDSEFFGMWRDRTDIADSIDFARFLRSQSWKRSS